MSPFLLHKIFPLVCSLSLLLHNDITLICETTSEIAKQVKSSETEQIHTMSVKLPDFSENPNSVQIDGDSPTHCLNPNKCLTAIPSCMIQFIQHKNSQPFYSHRVVS